MLVLDPRHLGKPSCFDGTQEGSYDEWRFQLVAYLASVDPRFGDVADDAARRTTPYLLSDLPPDEEGKKAHLMLYAVIVGCIKNRPLRLIMDTPSRDRREPLRKLDAEYRPTHRGRQMALLRRIVRPKLNSAGSDAEYIDKLSEWQQLVREYERISGSELDQTVKTATLMEEAPPQMQKHLSSVAFRGNWHRLQESNAGDRGLPALEENLEYWP